MINPTYAIVALTVFALVLTQMGNSFVEAKRNQGSQRKQSYGNNHGSGVTQSSYNPQSSGGSNSHADVAKLSYPNYNSQPNRPHADTGHSNNPPPIGWNTPGQGHSSSSNVHQPITATQNHGTQNSAYNPNANHGGYQPSGGYQSGGAYQPSGGYHPGGAPIPAGASYHPAGGALPPGATYHPAGGVPPGASYYPAGGALPAGASYHPAGGTYHPGVAGPPPGATYYQSPAALPPGATYYAQPPQQSSSGLGFGTGLLAGGLGGALLGHALTPSGGSSQPVAAAPAAAGGTDRIIIINNGVPVNATDGTTVINAGGAAAVAPAAVAPAAGAAAQPATALAPMANNVTMPANGTDAAAPPPPPAGGIICVPTKVNETDPADSTKMIEVEKIACYPAPQPPAAGPGEGPAPLAPMNPMPQPVQNAPQPVVSPPDQAAVRSSSNGAATCRLDSYAYMLVVLFGALMVRSATNGN